MSSNNPFKSRFKISGPSLTPIQKTSLVSIVIGCVCLIAVYGIGVVATPTSTNSFSDRFSQLLTTLGIVLTIIGVVALFLLPWFQDEDKYKKNIKSLERETKHSIRELKPRLRGIKIPLQRDETSQIQNELMTHGRVLLTGDAGIGKSGIGVAIYEQIIKTTEQAFLFDTRRLASVNDPMTLRTKLVLDEPVEDVVGRLNDQGPLYMIFDQLDNIVSSDACQIIIDLIIVCASLANTKIVVISRHDEANEQGALRPLLEAGFQEVACKSLDENTVKTTLRIAGIEDAPSELIQLGNNILHLEIICEIFSTNKNVDLSNVQNEIDLWEKYIETIRTREGRMGEPVIQEAVRLARVGLNSNDRFFTLTDSTTLSQRRLISNRIIQKVNNLSVRYRFMHENFQDYLYARDAAQQELSVAKVKTEINYPYARGVLLKMQDLYRRNNSACYELFLEELISG